MQTIVELPTGTDATAVYSGQPVALPLPPEVTGLPYQETTKRAQTAMAGMELTRIQQQSLEALAVYHQATADLLLRHLGLSPNSIRHLQKNLDGLTANNPEDRFVEELLPPKQTRFGSSQTVFALGRHGFAHLKDEGLVSGRYRADLQKGRPLQHRLAVNEFLVRAFQLEMHYPGVLFTEHIHEKEWLGNSLKVDFLPFTGEHKVVGVCPDLLLDFRIETPTKHYRFLPEINLWRKSAADWIAKVRAYLFCLDAYEARFRTTLLSGIPVMIATPTDFPRRDVATLRRTELEERKREAKRRELRLTWFLEHTQHTLTEHGMEEDADLFYFSCHPLDEISAFDLFFSPIWTVPFFDDPRPLMHYQLHLQRGVGDI